jgi:hypothetical protein
MANKITQFYTAFSGYKTGEVGGRDLIEKLYNVKNLASAGIPLDVSFAGSNRPEHKTVDIDGTNRPVIAVEDLSPDPSPSPRIPDFIPDAGYIACWVDMVNDPNGQRFVFSNGDTGGNELSISFDPEHDSLTVRLFGDVGIAYTFPSGVIDWDLYERKVLGFFLQWDADEFRINLLEHSPQIEQDWQLWYGEGYTELNLTGKDSSLNLGCSRDGDSQGKIYFHTLVADAESKLSEPDAVALMKILAKGFVDVEATTVAQELAYLAETEDFITRVETAEDKVGDTLTLNLNIKQLKIGEQWDIEEEE